MEHAKDRKQSNIFLPEQIGAVFGPGFLGQAACREWILRKLHPAGAFCPWCQAELFDRSESRFWDGFTIRCRECRKAFTAKTGTILAGKGFTYQEVFLMGYLLACERSDLEISVTLNCNRETIRLWRKKYNAWRLPNAIS